MQETTSPTLYDNFFSNLFGAIAGISSVGRQPGGIDFIPTDGGGKTIPITSKGLSPVWLGLRNPLQQKFAYEFCYPVAAVCDKLAEMDTNGKLEIIRAKGKGAFDYATSPWAKLVSKRLAQPNVLQTWEQFRGQQIVYKKVFGFCPVLPVVPAGFEDRPEYCSSMINLPPWLFEAVSTKKLLYQTTIEEIVKEYRVTILDTSFKLQPSQVFILEDSFMQDDLRDLLLPKSRLCGLDFAVSNICAAMEADNVLLRKKGPMGIFSPSASKDGMGSMVPMSDDERADVQKDLSAYGISWSQYQYMISRISLQWQSIGYNNKELQTKETVVQGEKAICHRYNFPYVLYEETESAYANVSTAAQSVYQNNVIPNNQKDLNKYNKFFKAEENNAIIQADYFHLSVMQEDAAKREQAAFFQSQALQIQYLNSIITQNQWLTAQGYDTVPDGDKYLKDTKTVPALPPAVPPVV